MKKGLRISILILVLCLAFPRYFFPCSSFAFLNKGYLVFGTNYDNDFWPGQLFFNQRNIRKSSWETGTTGKAAAWTSRYGSVTISCAGFELPWAGMNEAGLVFSTMALGETAPPAPDERLPLRGPFWWQYLLDTCATIEDILAADKEVRITDTGDHYFVSDRTGESATIEFLGGKMVVHRAKSLPVKALTNWTYAECLDHWSRKQPSPGDPYHSLNRFSRLAERLAKHQEGSPAAAVDYAFGLLGNVSASNTRWSLVFDTGNLTFFFKTFKNSGVRSIDLKKIDFSCGRPVKMLDAHAGLEGDITSSFKDYSHELVLDHYLKAIKYFRPDMPEEFIRKILAFVETFSCQSGNK